MSGPSLRRAYLEARAATYELLGTQDLDEKDLCEEVITRERGAFAGLEVVPSCFGLLWEATSNPECRGCQIQTLCLHRFALKTLPERIALKRTNDMVVLGRSLLVETQAVIFARDFAVMITALPEATKGAVPSPPGKRPRGRPKGSSSKNKSSMTCPPTSVVPAPVAEPSSGAAPALPAKAPAVCSTITCPAPSPQRIPWGEHTFMNRWLREREKMPMLGYITPGMTLHKLWEGRFIRVTCRLGYYEYEKTKYPTLYAVVKAITGGKTYNRPKKNGRPSTSQRVICNWSASRFFREALKEICACS